MDKVEHIVNKILVTPPQNNPDVNQANANFNRNKDTTVRERRSALQTATMLQSLAKRVNVIESR